MKDCDFEVWWHNVGSGIATTEKDDMKSHTKRVAALAWTESSAVLCRQTTNDEANNERI